MVPPLRAAAVRAVWQGRSLVPALPLARAVVEPLAALRSMRSMALEGGITKPPRQGVPPIVYPSTARRTHATHAPKLKTPDAHTVAAVAPQPLPKGATGLEENAHVIRRPRLRTQHTRVGACRRCQPTRSTGFVSKRWGSTAKGSTVCSLRCDQRHRKTLRHPGRARPRRMRRPVCRQEILCG